MYAFLFLGCFAGKLFFIPAFKRFINSLSAILSDSFIFCRLGPLFGLSFVLVHKFF